MIYLHRFVDAVTCSGVKPGVTLVTRRRTA